MSFLGGGGGAPDAPKRVQPPPRVVDSADLGKQQERARQRRARGSTTLLSRGLLTQEPSTMFPQLRSTLG